MSRYIELSFHILAIIYPENSRKMKDEVSIEFQIYSLSMSDKSNGSIFKILGEQKEEMSRKINFSFNRSKLLNKLRCFINNSNPRKELKLSTAMQISELRLFI
ncbi:hypothetical protein BpHYR1_037815 [Brachionus plicatilis]|uniref:Uncharacterized protein n=1 Tax=Brachionus plicatilis TaxID=10195 RepID=A0A3M7QJW6_BRAPC|nr:hypothetical protein BpHYR1_037815 [Brachionus plicatilis]